MKLFTRSMVIFISFILFYFMLPGVAYAYIDPGTGSYMLQLVIALLLGGLFAVKLFWKNIKIFLGNLFFRRKKYEKNKD